MDKPDMEILKQLKTRPEWKELLKYIDNRRIEYMNKIIRAAPDDAITIANHQGRLHALDLIVNIVQKD